MDPAFETFTVEPEEPAADSPSPFFELASLLVAALLLVMAARWWRDRRQAAAENRALDVQFRRRLQRQTSSDPDIEMRREQYLAKLRQGRQDAE